MSYFTQCIIREIEEKLSKDLRQQGANLTEKAFNELVNFELEKLAQKLVSEFMK